MTETIEYWTAEIEKRPAVADLYFKRGCLRYRNNDFGGALNDFNRALALDADHTAARQMREMVREILDFRNFDLYNP